MWVEHEVGLCGWSMRVVYMGVARGCGMFVEHEGRFCGWSMRVVYVGVT